MISTILTYPKILTYDNLPDRGLLLGKTSTQTVSIIDFLIDNIQLPAHFKMSVKPNENRSIITKKFSPIFGQKESTRNSAIGWDPADTKEYLSDIIRVKSGELNVMKFKNSSGNINCSAFHWGERNYVKYIKEIENLSLLHLGVAGPLHGGFSRGTEIRNFPTGEKFSYIFNCKYYFLQ